jgi:hypothetical protein
MNKQKKILAVLTSGLLAFNSLAMSIVQAGAGPEPPPVEDDEYTFPDPSTFSYDDVEVNFAKALQLSMYFYDANKCGTGITGGNLEWRGDCHVEDTKISLKPMGDDYKGTNLTQDFIDKYKSILDPENTGFMELGGGMHDAGDHVKFGLPGAYAASTVGWGYYEFRDAYVDTGLQWHIEDILHWFNDFYMKATYLDENEKVIAFCYQVGEGNIDHNYWNPPELQNESLLDFARPAYFATTETPASDMCAGTAASLAINYLNFKDTEPEYAAESLKKAIALYEFSVENRGLGYDGGFYTSSYDHDELAWAAVWLYECTGDWQYIDDIIKVDETKPNDMGAVPYVGYFERIISDTGNCWQNIWVHCWDTVWGGVFAKLAPITNTARDWYIFRWNLEYWSGYEHIYPGAPDDLLWKTEFFSDSYKNAPTTDGAFLAKTPAGFSMLNNYGSARYDTAAQLCALVYTKETGDTKFLEWADEQMQYIMGKNPMNRSYIVGYAENSAKRPHHRASHGSKTLNMDVPWDQVHVLWGALVGGPDADDWHRDITKDYIYNEVAVDYNAAFVGAAAGLYHFYGKDAGHKPITGQFPPSELSMKGEIREFYAEAKLEQENAGRTQVTVNVFADTNLPPRYITTLKMRYFFDISELAEFGQSIADLTVDIYYDENETKSGAVKLSEPVEYAENCYYIEIDWSGYDIFGTREIHFGLVPGMDENFEVHWNPTNDYSREGITETYALTNKVTLYVDDKLVWGIEPNGNYPVPPPIDVLLGDVNKDGKVDIADVILLSRFLVGNAELSSEQKLNANVENRTDATIDVNDTFKIVQYIAKFIDTFA